MTSWGGVSGLGLGLPLLWTELESRWSLQDIVAALSSKQAKQVGLEGRKGELVVGADADFVVFDPQAEFQVTLVSLSSRKRAENAGNTAVPEQSLAIPRENTERTSAADLASGPISMGRDEGEHERAVDIGGIPMYTEMFLLAIALLQKTPLSRLRVTFDFEPSLKLCSAEAQYWPHA